MIQRYGPILCGLLVMVSLISLTTLVFCLVGFSRSEALYLACLTGAALLYLVSRQALRRK
jgi:hypothetical protein